MYCNYCGKEVMPNARFCGSCGKPLSVVSEEESAGNNEPVSGYELEATGLLSGEELEATGVLIKDEEEGTGILIGNDDEYTEIPNEDVQDSGGVMYFERYDNDASNEQNKENFQFFSESMYYDKKNSDDVTETYEEFWTNPQRIE